MMPYTTSASVIRFLLSASLVSFMLLVSVSDLSGQLTEAPQVSALMERWKAYNRDHQEIRGWRIQILATVDRRQVESIRRQFENRYPDYPVHFVHNDPYYHLKVGAFMTMQKAQAFLRKMQTDYPQAIPVTDHLKVEELLLYDQ